MVEVEIKFHDAFEEDSVRCITVKARDFTPYAVFDAFCQDQMGHSLAKFLEGQADCGYSDEFDDFCIFKVVDGYTMVFITDDGETKTFYAAHVVKFTP